MGKKKPPERASHNKSKDETRPEVAGKETGLTGNPNDRSRKGSRQRRRQPASLLRLGVFH